MNPSLNRTTMFNTAISAQGLPTRITAALLACVLTACGGGADTPVQPQQPAVATISIDPPSAVLKLSENRSFSATPRDASGNPVTSTVVTWQSESPAIAAVDASGRVTAMAEGSTVISASGGGKSASASVKVVRPPITSIVVAGSNLLLTEDSVRLTATVKDSTETVITNRTVSWSVSDASRARITSSGTLTALAAGTVTVTAAVDNARGVATITLVRPPVTSISVVAPASILVVDSATLSVTVRDSAGRAVTDRPVTWSVSDAGRARITSSGTLTALAAGSVTVTAAVDNARGTATIGLIRPPVTNVSVVAPANLLVGDSAIIGVTVSDSAGRTVNDRIVQWSTSDNSIATIGTNGVLRLIASGSVSVSASVEAVKSTSSVRVTYPSRFLDSRVFAARYYVESNADIAASVTSDSAARDHWLFVGIREGRKAHSNFAVQEYLSMNPAARQRTSGNFAAAIDDYLTVGVPNGLTGIASPILNEGPQAIPMLAQPTLAEQLINRPIVGFWSLGRNAIGDRPAADLSPFTGLAVPAPRTGAQQGVAGWNANASFGPAAAQIYNGWVGISNDTRAGRALYAAQQASPDTPIDINFAYGYTLDINNPRPFADGNRGLVWETDMQIPTAGRIGGANSYAIQYFFLRDDVTGIFISYGTLVFDTRGSSFPDRYIAYDACSLCTQFLIVQTKLGSGAPWHSLVPYSTSFTGQTYREIRRVGFTIDAAQFLAAIRTAKLQYPAIAGVSEDVTKWRVTAWVLDIENGAVTTGDSWIGASVRLLRAGVLR